MLAGATVSSFMLESWWVIHMAVPSLMEVVVVSRSAWRCRLRSWRRSLARTGVPRHGHGSGCWWVIHLRASVCGSSTCFWFVRFMIRGHRVSRCAPESAVFPPQHSPVVTGVCVGFMGLWSSE
jgi:hypothetical protein